MADKWRSLNPKEAKILERMLEADFPGADVLRKQVPGLEVRRIDGEESFELRVMNQVRALLKNRVPVQAEYSDTEPYEALGQVHVHFLLHVTNGLMSELEVYKDDGTTTNRLPELCELHVFTPSSCDNE